MEWAMIIQGAIVWSLAFLTAKVYVSTKPDAKTINLILATIFFAFVYALVINVVLGFFPN